MAHKRKPDSEDVAHRLETEIQQRQATEDELRRLSLENRHLIREIKDLLTASRGESPTRPAPPPERDTTRRPSREESFRSCPPPEREHERGGNREAEYLRRQVRQLERELKDHEQHAEAIHAARDRIRGLEQDVESMGERIRQLEMELLEREGEIDSLRVRSQELEVKNKDYTEQLEIARQALNEINGAL